MFQVPRFEIYCTEKNFERASEDWEGFGKQGGLRKLQEKGVSWKRKLVRMSNATEKTVRGGPWPVGGRCSPWAAFGEAGAEALGWEDKDEQKGGAWGCLRRGEMGGVLPPGGMK